MKKRIGFILTATLLIVVCLTSLFACTALFPPTAEPSVYADTRVHDIEVIARSAFDGSDCEMTSLKSEDDGFQMTAVSKAKKSQITGILYTGEEDVTVDVDCNLSYHKATNTAVLETENEELDYYDSVTYQPDMSVPGKFDGTVYIEGQGINVFALEDELYPDIDEDEAEECFAITLSLIGALLSVFAVATVAVTMAVYPEYYVKGFEALGKGLESLAKGLKKIVVAGLTFTLLIVDKQVLRKIERQNNQKEKYYIAIPITKSNIKDFQNQGVSKGDMIFSQYPLTKSNMIKCVREGYNSYTFDPKDAKKLLSSMYPFDIKWYEKDKVPNRYYHYHAHPLFRSKENARNECGNKVHSFYGIPC